MNRFLFSPLFLLLSASSLLITACGQKQQKSEQAAMAVIVAPALKKELVSSREVIGQTRAYDNVELVARVQGFLTKRLFKEGQDVKKGDMLFEIEKDQYQADLQSAKANLLRAQAQLDNAEIEYKRNKGLIEKNAIAQREFDLTNFKYMDAKAAVMSAEAQVKKAQINLNYTNIEAPFDGRIGMTYISVGNMVGTTETKLAIIVSVEPMRVQFNISELDLLALGARSGSFDDVAKHVKVRIKFQNGSMYKETGSLYFINNSVNPSTATILVEALFPNKEGKLIPGYYVKVILEADFTSSGIVIPQSALMEGQAGTSVYVVNQSDNTVLRRMVKKGTVKAPFVEITEGLNEGDLVVTEGLQNLDSGIKVNYTYDTAYEADSKRTDPLHPQSDTQKLTK